MKIKVGNSEAVYLRQRIAKVGVTQKQLAERINVSERYIRDILSTQKDKEIQVDREKVEEILALLGIGLNHVFKHKQSALNLHPQLDLYIKTLKGKMYNLIARNRIDPVEQQNLVSYLDEDKAINKTMGFWYTLIVKTIGDKYQVMRDFFDKNDFFTIIPTEGYWRKFRHDASKQSNCYFSFKLIPKKENSTFRIAYTLESPINIGTIIPRKIKIVYGKIEQTSEYIKITQHHDTPASYKIYPTREIIVTTWLDEANHDFIIMSEDDFDLYTDNSHQPDQYQLGLKNKDQVQELFYALGTALFPRNHIFHRQGKEDMGDDPIFFWGNICFIEMNNPSN